MLGGCRHPRPTAGLRGSRAICQSRPISCGRRVKRRLPGKCVASARYVLPTPIRAAHPRYYRHSQSDNVVITSDSFRHRFFEANKPWIIQQLRRTMPPRAQLEALTKGELLPEGPDTKRGWIRGECRSRLDGVPARTASRAQPRPKLCRQ